MYFAPPQKGFRWELGIGARDQKLESWAIWPRKTFDDIFSRLDATHQRGGQTDGRTDRHRATAKTALTHSVAR